MKHLFYIIPLTILLISCKTKQSIINTTSTDVVSANVLINTHQAINTDFNTLIINANTAYKDNKNDQSFTTDIRIEKDKQILVSVKVFGLLMAKALITTNEVKYYEKINNTYFEGDFSQLGEWLGTPLDFEKVQNLLLGKTIQNLSEKKYESLNNQGFYSLNFEDENIKEFYVFETSKSFLKSQVIDQKNDKRQLKANYHSHQEVLNLLLPIKFDLQATQESNENTVDINIEYRSIKVNESLSFPYTVPNGYTKIQLN
jgi:hypothetical protein